jgi:hypothetical protein
MTNNPPTTAAETRTHALPDPIPTNPSELAELLAAQHGPGFDDALYEALVRQQGRERADKAWRAADQELEWQAQSDRALEDLTEALTDAHKAVRDAVAAVASLTKGPGWHIEYAESTTGEDITAHLEAAARSLRAAEALHRQAQP